MTAYGSAAAILLGTLLGLPASATPIPARAARPVNPASNAHSGLVPVFNPKSRTAQWLSPAAAAAFIKAYWTPSRRAAAKPLPASALPAGAGASRPPTTGAREVVSPVLPKVRVPRSGRKVLPADVPFNNAEGVVFFYDPGINSNASCSAGTISSGKRRLVLTAGHCVHDGGGGGWMQNWIFYPGYENGNAGFAGTFTAYQLWAKNEWINNDDHHYDYGMVITNTNSAGQRVDDVVGGNGYITNPGRPFVTSIGYPSNFDNGIVQSYCQGNLSRRSIFVSDQQLNCDLESGASGSPWLENYNTPSFPGLGWIVSDLSYALASAPNGPVYGPYYDDAFTSLYNAAEGASP